MTDKEIADIIHNNLNHLLTGKNKEIVDKTVCITLEVLQVVAAVHPVHLPNYHQVVKRYADIRWKEEANNDND